MDLSSNCKLSRLFACNLTSIICKCLALVTIALFFRAILYHLSSGDVVLERDDLDLILGRSMLSQSDEGIRRHKFLEIAFVRACLTARMLNRTLLIASLFYKEINLLQPISFDKVFKFERFNTLCEGFVQLARYSDLKNRTGVYDLRKGSGRKWTVERALVQLKQSIINDPIDMHEVIRMIGKNPFLWHDHWPVKDYARVFECLVLVDDISKEADKVVSKIRQIGRKLRSKPDMGSSLRPAPYVAVHMRVEIDWMIHCKKLEQRSGVSQICSSKQEIIERVGKIINLEAPIVVYLAVSAIDYEVCSKADIFVGNSFSTFSSLIVFERTQKMMRMGITSSCKNENEVDVQWPSYAYNIAAGESNGPQKWMTNMSDSSLKVISYGSYFHFLIKFEPNSSSWSNGLKDICICKGILKSEWFPWIGDCYSELGQLTKNMFLTTHGKHRYIIILRFFSSQYYYISKYSPTRF
ncbi:hypothetical protein GOBAR_AA33457 [Gossypium barbadense]|uniref:O-fucosyltransferase family protein n=1 Tax=Gossypium barbadense TaxID=3634 RepID=A0A2P5W839_GOSBA|nr:hypothetical protein GOBAR_AA33457 [Gossypium barbadense]